MSALISADSALPNRKYLEKAEIFYSNLEKVFLHDKELHHTNSKSNVFLEDYAYSIAMLIDLYESTLKPNYLVHAKKMCAKAIDLFLIKETTIFQKNTIINSDLFHKAIDISDHTIPNGNSIMLLNFSRLGMLDEGKKLSNSLNGYLNVYKSLMLSSLKSIDYFISLESGKKCNQDGCVSK